MCSKSKGDPLLHTVDVARNRCEKEVSEQSSVRERESVTTGEKRVTTGEERKEKGMGKGRQV